MTFTVAATGSPTPTVQWQMSVDAGKTFSGVEGSQLQTSFIVDDTAVNVS